MNKCIMFLATLAVFQTARAQQNPQQLLDVAILNHFRCQQDHKMVPVFVWEVPLQKSWLRQDDPFWTYDTHIQEWPVPADSAVVMELISKIPYRDTTHWQQEELSHGIVCHNRKPFSFPVLQKKLHLKSNQIPVYQQQVDAFNGEKPEKRPIVHYSRPVFDHTGKFALIEFYEPGQSFGSRMYQYTKQGWKELGMLNLGHF